MMRRVGFLLQRLRESRVLLTEAEGYSTFLMSLFFLTVHRPSDSLSKYLRALGAWSSMWLGGIPSTSTILFIWSTWKHTGREESQKTRGGVCRCLVDICFRDNYCMYRSFFVPLTDRAENGWERDSARLANDQCQTRTRLPLGDGAHIVHGTACYYIAHRRPVFTVLSKRHFDWLYTQHLLIIILFYLYYSVIICGCTKQHLLLTQYLLPKYHARAEMPHTGTTLMEQACGASWNCLKLYSNLRISNSCHSIKTFDIACA